MPSSSSSSSSFANTGATPPFEPPDCDPLSICSCCPPDGVQTKAPVRYWNGAAILQIDDLSTSGGGLFSQTRYYGNKTNGNYDGPNGFNWFLRQLPYVVANGSPVAVVFDPNNPYWFDPATAPNYTARYGTLDVKLVQDTTAQTFTFTLTSGGRTIVTVFNNFAAATAPGGFVSQTDTSGVQISVFSRNGTGQPTELRRTFAPSGGTTVVEALIYTYVSGGTASGRIQSVTYRRSVGGGSFADVKQVTYAYYVSTDTHGSQNDLKSATQQLPNGSGGWNTIALEVYRYWLAGDANGFAHGLKLHFGPEACRLIFNAGLDVYGDSDTTLKPYADHYFQYDSSRRVTQEISAVCTSCVGGGTTGDNFIYTTNPSAPSTPDYNAWAVRAEQDLPDGTKIYVYTSGLGTPMLQLTVDPSGTQLWGTFTLYDSTATGKVKWMAHPSAVKLPTGSLATVLAALEAHNDLMFFDGTLTPPRYTYLNDYTGLIDVTSYYSSTGSGGVQYYPQYTGVRQGQVDYPPTHPNPDVVVATYTYSSHADTAGNTIYPAASVVQYPVAGSLTPTITTTYTYAWYSGTNQMSAMTTTLPVTSTGQNGDGLTYTKVQNFDAFGNVISTVDERGIVNQYVNDVSIGAVTQQILNVQSGVTAPGVNVTSDMTYDNRGRLTQTLGPSHTVVLTGTATTVRAANWNVYVESVQPGSGTWGPDQTWSGRGYATGTSPSYTYTLVDPVSIRQMDKDGRSLGQITSKRSTGSGALSSTDTFAQTDWRSWSSTQYNITHQTTSSRVYHVIPSSGDGSAGTNYGQSNYGYDALERRNKVAQAGGTMASPAWTITRTVWNSMQWVVSSWVGTDDTGATDSNPAGFGAPNNMVKVSENQYDGNAAGGDGNLTQVTAYADTSDTRVTTNAYDFRNRPMSTDGEVDFYQAYTYDNLGRRTQTDNYNTTSGGNLIGRTQSKFDDRSRRYQNLIIAVDPSTGATGNSLTGNTWYDPSGNVIQQQPAGAGQVFDKTTYNGVNWVTGSYSGYNTSGTSYSQANTVANDTIFSQSIPTYDEAGNVVSTASYQRLNDAPATGTGSTGALSAGTNPKARISYGAAWYDGIDRAIASAAYGAISSFTRPSTPPASSDTVLVSSVTYDDAGRAWKTIDPRGIENHSAFDAASRTTQTVEAYSLSTGDDLNRTTNYTYTLDSLKATMTAVNARTGDQTTNWTYGTTLTESAVARTDLLRYTDYPDSVSGSDRTANAYNRLGQLRTFTDQRGTVRSIYYDKLGRFTNDCVTTNGTGTDVATKQIMVGYEVRGMANLFTSTDSATQGGGTVLNQCKLNYNTFAQLIEEDQSHSGSVVTGTTPSVQYGYDSGGSGSNEIRPISLTYPNARSLTYDYGTSGGPNDRLNRVNAIKDGSTSLAAYTYLGAGTVIRIDYTQPKVWLDLWGGTSGSFAGIDLFGRVIDQRWQKYGSSSSSSSSSSSGGGYPIDIDRYKYGYDRDSNRTWKQNVVSAAASVPLDEFYTMDNLNRLATMQRGTLTGSPPTGISGTPVKEQDWTLDPTGNWRGYITKTSGTTDLNQRRTSNPVNEITNITESTGPTWIVPAYDPAGNTTTFPQPTPTSSFTAAYDAWNRMTAVNDGANAVAKYDCDGRNRRIISRTYTTGTLTETRHAYYTNSWQNIEERVGTNTTADTQHVWGIRYIDELVCRDDATPARIYACQDANFNVTCLTSTVGVVQQRFGYEPYGNAAVLTTNWTGVTDAYQWTYRFQGGRWDSLTTGVYFRNRIYDLVTGTWKTRDPLGAGESGLNSYAFANTNPMRLADPLGLKPRPIFHPRTGSTEWVDDGTGPKGSVNDLTAILNGLGEFSKKACKAGKGLADEVGKAVVAAANFVGHVLLGNVENYLHPLETLRRIEFEVRGDLEWLARTHHISGQINDNKFGHSMEMSRVTKEFGIVVIPIILCGGVVYEIVTVFKPGHVQGDEEGYNRPPPYYGLFDGQNPINWAYDTPGDLLANVVGAGSGAASLITGIDPRDINKYTTMIPGPDYSHVSSPSGWTDLAYPGAASPKQLQVP